MLCLLVRASQPELASLVALLAGAMALLYAAGVLEPVLGGLQRIAALGGVEAQYLGALLKVLGVACLSELAAQSCKDLGEEGLAVKVGFCGRALLLSLAVPMLTQLLEMILTLAP